jgi:hypothetical protein
VLSDGASRFATGSRQGSCTSACGLRWPFVCARPAGAHLPGSIEPRLRTTTASPKLTPVALERCVTGLLWFTTWVCPWTGPQPVCVCCALWLVWFELVAVAVADEVFVCVAELPPPTLVAPFWSEVACAFEVCVVGALCWMTWD